MTNWHDNLVAVKSDGLGDCSACCFRGLKPCDRLVSLGLCESVPMTFWLYWDVKDGPQSQVNQMCKNIAELNDADLSLILREKIKNAITR
ncbi:MAG: hypothetical protein LBJ73_01935 [Rickettsiales bacterium]|jgi:hypothetical protein|nr:hypothetical protein [Rickettsiales bacterium]